MKKNIYILSTLLFIFTASCKKEETPTPSSPTTRTVEVSGYVLDWYTKKPIPDVNVSTSRSISIEEVLNFNDAFQKFGFTDVNGTYKFDLKVKDSVSYFLNLEHYNYVRYNGFYYDDNWGSIIFYWNNMKFEKFRDTTYMTKASNLILKYAFKTDKDTLYYKHHHYDNGKKVGFEYDLPLYKSYVAQEPVYEHKTLADKYLHISYRWNTEKNWRQDSIFMPFGKSAVYEIKD
jgi:hypothetical protein